MADDKTKETPEPTAPDAEAVEPAAVEAAEPVDDATDKSATADATAPAAEDAPAASGDAAEVDAPVKDAPAAEAPAAEASTADEPASDETAAEPAAAEPQTAEESEPIEATIDLGKDARYTATGKRKRAIARVILKPGNGTITVNGREFTEYFPRPVQQVTAKLALTLVGYDDKMDVIARIHGGGTSAQAGALRHGISRALLEASPSMRGELKRRGLLTRDSRVKERKKAGLKKARKKPQFSKR